MLASVTLARNVDNHTLGNTSRNLDFDNFLAFFNTSASTMLTLILDDGTLTTTSRTNTLSLHHSEDTLRGMGDDTGTMARRTLIVGAAGFCSATVTMRAGNVLTNLKLFGNTMCNLLQ